MIRVYLEMSALLVVGLLAFACVRWALAKLHPPVSSTHQLLLAQTLFLGSLLVPAAVAWTPKEALFTPSVEVWSGNDTRGTPVAQTVSGKSLLISSSSGFAAVEVARDQIAFVAAALIASIFIGRSVLVARLRKVERMLSNLPVIRRLGRVRIAVSDESPVPFSARVSGRAFVVIPASFVSHRRDYRIAIHHELQHHRQNDPSWAIAIETVRVLFFWHPVVRAWASQLEQQQEFACDEALVCRKRLSARDYSQCLLRAAKSAMRSSHRVVGATAMAGAAHAPLLRKRIEMILDHDRTVTRPGIWVVATIGACAIGTMTGLAYASRSVIQDRTISRAQAEALVENTTRGGNPIQLVANERVLARLNTLVGTPDGRQWLKDSLARMQTYEPMIRQKLLDNGMPEEFLALPLVESGYRNDLISPRSRAAGIWQFIPGTARRLKLTDEGGRDDRLDPEKQTDAAIALLTDLHETFRDWRLAIRAYNEGATSLSMLIAEQRTIDPWELEQSASSEDYLSGVIAAMIVLRNPELLD
jgi:membrane-bound lytic murein transglycosylase D